MSDNGLPKATMVNYIKDRISDKRKVSAQFTTLLLQLSKQFIDKVSAQANQICQKEGKKTINNQHFFRALKQLGMGDIIIELEKTDESLKMKQQKKQQDKQRVQENIQKMNKRCSEMEQQKGKERLPIIGQKSAYKPIQIEEEVDFVVDLEKDNQQQSQSEHDEKQ